MAEQHFEHEKMKESVAAYSIGALDEQEIAEVTRHLETCDECRTDLESFREVGMWLSQAHHPASVPVGFQERVLAEARRRSPDLPVTVPRESRRLALRTAIAAVLASVIAFAGFSLISLRDDKERQQAVIVALLESDQQIELSGSTDAVGRVVSVPEGAVFVASDLSPLPSGSTYQLWLKKGARIVSAGVFEPADGIAIVRIDEPFAGFGGALVTTEPAGGSPQPTSDPVIDSI